MATVKDPKADPRFDFVTGRVQAQNVDHDGQIAGAGASDNYYELPTTAGNAFSYYLSNNATTGTVRGEYIRLALPSGAGGEAVRAYTTVSNNTPADTVNGVHNSLSFGASAGNVTGEANASRNTLAVPARTLGGTCAAVNAELWADGTTSNMSNGSAIRCNLGGDATGVALLDDNISLISFDGGTNNTGNVCSAVGNEPTWSSATHKIRVKINGTTMYLVAVLA